MSDAPKVDIVVLAGNSNVLMSASTSLSIKAPAVVTFAVVTKLVIPEPSPTNEPDIVEPLIIFPIIVALALILPEAVICCAVRYPLALIYESVFM